MDYPMRKIIGGGIVLVLGMILFSPQAKAQEPCNLIAPIDQTPSVLASVSLQVSSVKYTYTEIRAGSKRKFTDPEKQIALNLLNQGTCQTEVIVITKRGDQLIAPEGYQIEAVKRVNGIRWNNWATSYRVIFPEGWIVIGNKYPLVQETTSNSLVKAASGKIVKKKTTTRTITEVLYTPFHDQLMTPELVRLGHTYPQDLTRRVDETLRAQGVMSLAYPDMLVVDVTVLKPEFTQRRLPIEHMDESEFLLDPAWTTSRVAVLIGANRERMSTFTCSPAAACGPMQFIRSTWQLMDKSYPKANLPDDFSIGARDAFSAMMAARLLDDYNLAVFKRSLTFAQFQKLIADTRMTEEALASAYNTGATRTLRVLKAYFANPKKYSDWAQAKGIGSTARLVAETKGYLAKLRYLQDRWPQQSEVSSR